MSLQDLLVQLLNVSLMFSVGLELDLVQLRAALRRRGLLVAMVAFNFGVIPLLAFVTTEALALPAAVTAGVLLAAFAPGGGTGTLLTRITGGNLALSVAMLIGFTALAVPLTPALTMLSSGSFGPVDLHMGGLLWTLVVFQLTPLLLGAGLRVVRHDLARKANRVAGPVSNITFAALVVGLLVTKAHLTLQIGAPAFATVTLLAALSMGIPLLVRSSLEDRAALSLTSGVRNLSLALLLSATFFTDLTTITVLTYGLCMYALAIPLALWLRARTKRSHEDPHV